MYHDLLCSRKSNLLTEESLLICSQRSHVIITCRSHDQSPHRLLTRPPSLGTHLSMEIRELEGLNQSQNLVNVPPHLRQPEGSCLHTSTSITTIALSLTLWSGCFRDQQHFIQDFLVGGGGGGGKEVCGALAQHHA